MTHTHSKSPIIAKLQAELQAQSDEKTRQSSQRFFKEPLHFRGVKSQAAAQVSKAFFAQVRQEGKEQVFSYCEELFSSGFAEDAWLAAGWAAKMETEFVPKDLDRFENWIARYVNNWASCDTLCNHAVGSLFIRFPELLPRLQSWAKSENRWFRRAAAVSLIVPAKNGMFLTEALALADMLLLDTDDMVQKGYGWLLKEESRKHQKEIYQYVLAHRHDMPRTALRYAIELMPKELKQEAMKRV